MRCFAFAAAALLAFAATLPAQTTGNPPQNPPAASHSKAPLQEAPGAGPDKVWVNTNSSVYHCPGDRYYGKTAHGRYMTEAAARSAGAKGVGGKTCFAGK